MKFSDIKPKIQNLGDFKSLAEIKAAGLRVVRNTKTGDYWLIEEEFLRPVIRSPRESPRIKIDRKRLRFHIIFCNLPKEHIRDRCIYEYINWGEQQHFNRRPTTSGRKIWYAVGSHSKTRIFTQMSFNNSLRFFFSEKDLLADARLYTIEPPSNQDEDDLATLLNSTFTLLQVELGGRANLGEGALDFKVYEAEELEVLKLKPLMMDETGPGDRVRMLDETTNWKLFRAFTALSRRECKSIFEECGIDPSKPTRSQEPKPLPDRKALDDIVFDALDLTEQERKEVYWAVCELVKNRLKKAKSV